MNFKCRYVPRNLSWIDEQGEEIIVSEDSLLTDYSRPTVILGEPGMGKTSLMEKLGDSSDWKFFRATTFLRQTVDSIHEGLQLIIDGLDEVAAMEEGDPLHNILKKLVACGKPPFIISCRAAEWRGAAARIEIEDEYGHSPKLLHLVPLTRNQATLILSCEVSSQKTEESIETLCSSGLETFFQNPLNLEFVATTLKKLGNLPRTKADLLHDATKALCRETNEIKFNTIPTTLSDDEMLDVAGCLMATMLLAGEEGISKISTASGGLKLSEISDLTSVPKPEVVLSSRLFRNFQNSSINTRDTEEFFPVHRTVAEYLGARWLANEVDKKDNSNRVARRLLSLISTEGGVPASLRGLHAWLLKFSPEQLGPKVIAQDPYGVIRYGDGDDLSVNQASQIINGLRQLAIYDPYFRYDRSGTLSTKGLVNIELVDEVRAIVRDPDEPLKLRNLMLDAMKGEELAAMLRPELQKIMMDTTRGFVERKQSCIVLVNIENHTFDWPSELRRLCELADDESNRLMVELIPEIGIEKFDDEQIANAVVALVGIRNKNTDDDSFRSYHSLKNLEVKIPYDRIKALLDQLTSVVSKYHDSEIWWDIGYDKRCRLLTEFTKNLISTLLEHDSNSVQPEQLWSWIRTLWSVRDRNFRNPSGACEQIVNDDRLRLGIQRSALFAKGTEDEFRLQQIYLKEFCNSFAVSTNDALIHLFELVERDDKAERIRWQTLVGMFRGVDDNLIPKAVQKLARPYADGDRELIDFLTKKPKRPKLSDEEKKYRRRKRDRERRRRKKVEQARAHYSSHIDEIRNGELQWILHPAQAYLGLFSDLEIVCEPRERISKWLGDDISHASLIGFEEVLKRPDLPSTKEIVDEYAVSGVWNFIFPMLAAAIERCLSGQDFEDLPTELVLSLAIISEQESSILNDNFNELTDVLNTQFEKKFHSRENFLQQKFELMMESNVSHVPGLYRFCRDDNERPFSTKLSLEWLKKYPNLPLNIVNELFECVIHVPNTERENSWHELARISKNRLDELIVVENSNQGNNASNEVRLWRSVQFLIDFETAAKHLPDITEENKDWLWSLTSDYYEHNFQNSQSIPVSIDQLKWIVTKFREFWPKIGRPDGVAMGIRNPWDATEIIERSIDLIAKEPSDEAASALSELRDLPRDSYTDYILSAIAQNRRAQIEAKFKSPTISQIKSVLTDGRPESAADVQSIVLDKLSELQIRLKGDSLNPVNNFYSDNGNPKTENLCRDQMLMAMGELPFDIQCPTEHRMPQNRRSDAAFVFHNIEVPLEAKGQWHNDVWTAASDQLDRYYCTTYKSQSKGIYVVFWFGNGNKVPAGKRLKPPPDDRRKPESPEDLRTALQALIPSERKSEIAIVVLDVTR